MRGAIKHGEPRSLSSSWRSHPEESAYYKPHLRERVSKRAEKACWNDIALAEKAGAKTLESWRHIRQKALGWTS